MGSSQNVALICGPQIDLWWVKAQFKSCTFEDVGFLFGIHTFPAVPVADVALSAHQPVFTRISRGSILFPASICRYPVSISSKCRVSVDGVCLWPSLDDRTSSSANCSSLIGKKLHFFSSQADSCHRIWEERLSWTHFTGCTKQVPFLPYILDSSVRCVRQPVLFAGRIDKLHQRFHQTKNSPLFHTKTPTKKV